MLRLLEAALTYRLICNSVDPQLMTHLKPQSGPLKFQSVSLALPIGP